MMLNLVLQLLPIEPTKYFNLPFRSQLITLKNNILRN